MFNIKTWNPVKVLKWKYLWCVIAATVLVLMICFVFLLVAQTRIPVDSNIRFGIGRLTTDYALAYKPDSLYVQPKPGEKEARLLTYIDHVTWKFSYKLEGFENMPAEYEYAVDAKLIARSRDSSKYIDPDFVIWEKDYQLVKPTKIASDSKTTGLSQQVDMNINQYTEFVKAIYEKTEVQTTNELRVIFHVKSAVHGPIEDTIDNNSVELVIPIVDNLLLITGTPKTENKLKMVIAPPAPLPNYIPWLFVTSALSLLLLVLTAMMTLRGKSPDAQTIFARTTARIFKQFGERLVLLQNPIPFQQMSTINIGEIGELIKIADEISQPVFYFKADTMEEKKIEFYVFDSGRIYYLEIKGEINALITE